MAKDLNGAWLALGVAGTVAAAGAAMRLSGSRALSGVDDLRRMTGKKPWSEMTQEEREREERGFQRFKQESRDEISRGRKKMEREPDWHTAWHDTSGELGQPADRATYDEDGFRIDSLREAARKRREADQGSAARAEPRAGIAKLYPLLGMGDGEDERKAYDRGFDGKPALKSFSNKLLAAWELGRDMGNEMSRMRRHNRYM